MIIPAKKSLHSLFFKFAVLKVTRTQHAPFTECLKLRYTYRTVLQAKIMTPLRRQKHPSIQSFLPLPFESSSTSRETQCLITHQQLGLSTAHICICFVNQHSCFSKETFYDSVALKINKECIHCPFILLLSTLLCNEQITAAAIFLAPIKVSDCKLCCRTNRSYKNSINFLTINVICLVGSCLVVMKKQPGFSLIHVLKYLQKYQYDLIITKLMIEKVI